MFESMRPKHRTQAFVVIGVASVCFVYFVTTTLLPYLISQWKISQERRDTLKIVKKKNESSSDMIDEQDANSASLPETTEKPTTKQPAVRLTKPNYLLPTPDLSLPPSSLTRRKQVSSVETSSSTDSTLSRPPATTAPISSRPLPTSATTTTSYNSRQAAERDFLLATRGGASRTSASVRSDSAAVRAQQDAEYAASIAREEALAKAKSQWQERLTNVLNRVTAEPPVSPESILINFKFLISNDTHYLLRNPSVTSYAFKRRFLVASSMLQVLDFAESKVYEVCKYDYDHNVVVTISVGYPVTKFERLTSVGHGAQEGLDRSLEDLGLRKDCVIWVAVTSPTDSKSRSK